MKFKLKSEEEHEPVFELDLVRGVGPNAYKVTMRRVPDGHTWAIATFTPKGVKMHSCIGDPLIPTDDMGKYKIIWE